TLADLKKHRSQNRSSVSPENGSLLSGTAPSLAGSIGNGTGGGGNGSITPNGASSGAPLELSLVSNELHHLHHSPHLNNNRHLQQQQHYGDGSVIGTGNGSLHGGPLATVAAIGEPGTPGGTLSKFSGNTSDVVSDSTRSRRCCVVM
uniref:Uncharacterized protein n=1 Tax=Anopheles maculatus TaxID=74869 RepID=A0A182SUJ4_9DIPT